MSRMIIENVPCQARHTKWFPNDSIRLKVTNRCPFSCHFCHHEGSRESGDLTIDAAVGRTLTELRDRLGLTQAHLTGGEPTVHPDVVALVGSLKDLGFSVKMTSNGQFDAGLLSDLRAVGLTGVNFSIHTLSPLKLASLQEPRRDITWAMRALQRQIENLRAGKKCGLDVKVNTVVEKDTDIFDIIDFCKTEGVKLRILDDLTPGSLSVERIVEVLASLRATVTMMNVIEQSSSYSYDIVCKDGFELRVKSIRKLVLRTLCGDCTMRDSCAEWFYGIRVEKVDETPKIRLCLHRQNTPAVQGLDEFLLSAQLAEMCGNSITA